MRYLIGDTETSGLGVEKKACEIALREVDLQLNTLQEWHSLVDPEIPINPAASAINGITDAMVAHAPTSDEFVTHVLGGKLEGDICLIGHNCLTGDHQILTPEGWVDLKELTGTVKAAQWDAGNLEITFEDCLVVSKMHTGKMYEYNTLYHKGVYSEGHKIYWKTSTDMNGPWRVSPVEEFATKGKNNLHIPVAGFLESSGPDLSLDACRVMEMLRADSNIELNGSVKLNLKKQRKIERCKRLLEACGMPYSIKVRKDGATVVSLLNHKVRGQLVTLLGKGKGKQYGSWVLTLSLAQRLAILDELRFWDGGTIGPENLSEDSRGLVLSSAKESELTWIATMAAVSGMCGKVGSMRPNTRGFSRPDSMLGRVTVRPRLTVKTLEHPAVTDVVDLPVYCLTTRTGAFLVRRKGVIWVTGNCSFDYSMLKCIGNITHTVCTLELARAYITGPVNYKLQTLREFFGIEEDGAHTAMGDVNVTHQLLRKLVEASGRDIYQQAITEKRMIHLMPFGKHAGKPILELPLSYLDWLLSLPDLDPAMRHSAETARTLK